MIRAVTGGAQARFWAGVGAERRRILDGSPDWPARLAAALDAADGQWPAEWLAHEDFAAELAQRLELEDDLGAVARWWDHLRAGDLYLACACARGIAPALQAFEKLYAGELARIARRFQRPDLGADDLIQLLRTKLFAPPLGCAAPESPAARPKIASYTGQGFLQNWVRVTATRTFIDGVRWQQADGTEEPIAPDLAELLQEPAANFELRMLKQEHAAHFKAAFADAVAALGPSRSPGLEAASDRSALDRSDRRALSPAPRDRGAPGGQKLVTPCWPASASAWRDVWAFRPRAWRPPSVCSRAGSTPASSGCCGEPRREPARAAVPGDETFMRLIEGTLPSDRMRELEAHCDGCARCARTLSELARAGAPDPPGWLGGRYQLLEPLGAGSTGVVFAALDAKLRRKVAIKRLREGDAAIVAGAAADRRRERFLREAQLLASLSHPNVLTVHDVGGIDREVYVVTELVDGSPMSRWVRETEPRPDHRRIIDLYLQVGRGLWAAHQLNVVHRDVKPENILVARNGRVLIGDFGLAGLTQFDQSRPRRPARPRR